MQLNPYKFAYVEWRDSQIGPQEWHTINERDNYCPVITSIGHVIEDNYDHIILYGSVIHYRDSDQKLAGCGSITIPKDCIIYKNELLLSTLDVNPLTPPRPVYFEGEKIADSETNDHPKASTIQDAVDNYLRGSLKFPQPKRYE